MDLKEPRVPADFMPVTQNSSDNSARKAPRNETVVKKLACLHRSCLQIVGAKLSCFQIEFTSSRQLR